MRAHAMVGAAVALLFMSPSCWAASSSANQTAKFKAGYSPVANQFGATSMAIGKAIQQASSQTDAQIATTFGRLATRWEIPLRRLRTLKPPSTLAAPFNALSRAATRAERDLNGIVTAAKTHSSSAAKRASASLVTDILAAKSASTTITNKLRIK